jgi:SsrA-binding protein
MNEGIKIIARNKRASFDYHIEDSYEAGLVLYGSEIKSVRMNRVNLADGFVQEKDGELWILNVHISTYDQASHFGHTDPMRPRKLLLHKREIAQVIDWIREQSHTAIPVKLYLSRGRAKIEIGLAKGKKLYDKRQDIAKRDSDRQVHRILKGQYD